MTYYYKLNDFQRVQGQETTNVYWFQNTLEDGSAEELAEAWETFMLPAVAAVQSVLGVHERILVERLGSDTDFFDLVLSPTVPGTLQGEALPRWDVWSFKYVRANKTVRNGAKRIGPISEGSTANGEPSGTLLDDLNALATAMQATLTGPSGALYRPIIMGLNPDGTRRASSGLLDVQYIRQSTQSSRK